MDEQKRLILAVVLSMIVLLGYQMFFVKPPEPVAPLPAVETSEENVTREKENVLDLSHVKPLVPVVSASAGVEAQPKNYRTIEVSTPLYHVVISEKGAAVKSFELKQFKETNAKDSPLKHLVPEQLVNGTLLFDLEGESIAGLKDAVYTASVDATATVIEQGKTSIEFMWTTLQGYGVKKIFTFAADSYVIDCDIVIENNTTGVLNDAIVISAQGIYTDETKSRSRFAFEGPMLYVDGEFTSVEPNDVKITEKDRKKESKVLEKISNSKFSGKIDWAGYSERYFMTAVMPKVKDDGTVIDGRVKLSYVDDLVTTQYIRKMDRLESGTSGVYGFKFYMGPKSQQVLSSYGNNLKESVNFGFFNIIAGPLLKTMNIIYGLIPNYGIAIILLTVFIKLVFWPLGTKSYKSMNKMKKVQPLMMEIREKYKDDKQKMNQEVMALYKTYKVNPAGGCLPLLVQMPIFFALYRMLYQAIELRHAPFFGWITDLSAPDRLFEFGFSIPMMQEPYGLPMLTLIMGASFFIQQKMSPTAGDPMQAKMMMFMPVMMTVIFINFPSGLVLYMFVNNIISMGQQYYIQKKQM
ncbi:MAG: membrane protein insertase YidC [Pseudomonadota bacterium]